MTGRDSKDREADRDERSPKPAEDELDKTLADSFPASDPPAPVIKGTVAGPIPDKERGARR